MNHTFTNRNAFKKLQVLKPSTHSTRCCARYSLSSTCVALRITGTSLCKATAPVSRAKAMPRITHFAKQLPKYSAHSKIQSLTRLLLEFSKRCATRSTYWQWHACGAGEKGGNGVGQGCRMYFLIMTERGSCSFSISRALQGQNCRSLPFVTLQTCAFLLLWQHFQRTPLNPV